MTRLSENTLVPQANTQARYVPFTAYARIVPDTGFGRRFERIRDREKIADDIEDRLRDIDEDITVVTIEDYDIAFPIASTPQFGNKPARVTIHGNWRWPDGVEFTKTPVGEQTVVSSGEIKTGPSSHNAASMVADSDLLSAIRTIKEDLETACTDGSETFLNIIKMEVTGMIFGEGGRSFPA